MRRILCLRAHLWATECAAPLELGFTRAALVLQICRRYAARNVCITWVLRQSCDDQEVLAMTVSKQHQRILLICCLLLTAYCLPTYAQGGTGKLPPPNRNPNGRPPHENPGEGPP